MNLILKKQIIIVLSAIMLFPLFSGPVYANNIIYEKYQDKRITLKHTNAPIKSILASITSQTDLKFIFEESVLEKVKNISIDIKSGTLNSVLNEISKQTGLVFRQNDNTIAVSIGATTHQAPQATKQQPDKISGTILDINNEPLIGVSVTVKGTTKGTITDEYGKYQLDISGDETLVFSYIGYETKEVVVKDKSVINLTLNENLNDLNEVVVIGYGTQRKGDITSSVASIKSEEFIKGAVKDAGQLIQGKVAGMTIINPSGDPTSGTQVLLRGNTTILGANSDPLVLIDGVPGSFNTVAPEDIESVDVLKDGSAAAIYGTRGTNGVILITTKKAKGAQINEVEYSGYISTSQIVKRLKMLTAEDYRNQIADGTRDASWDHGASTDWLDEITRTPFSHVHNISLKGGTGSTNYIANLNYRSLQGVFKESDNSVFQGRIEINHRMLDDKLKLNFSILGKQNQFSSTSNTGSFNGYTYRQSLIHNPTDPVKNADGSWYENPNLFEYENPVARLLESDGNIKNNETRYTGNITLDPINELKLNALFSYTRTNRSHGYYETKNHISTVRDGLNGWSSSGFYTRMEKLLELTAQYSKEISGHKFMVLGGYSYQETDFEDNYMSNYNFQTDYFSWHNMGIGAALKEGLAGMSTSKERTNLIGFFGRATYSYQDKYLLMASLRHEAASQLWGTKSPWGTFPSVSLGWRITGESFMQDQHIFDDLKLRAGYGVTGSQPSDSFRGVALLSYGSYFYSNGKWIQTINPSQNANPYLKWEEKKETNIGLDFSLKKGRITGSIDYYNRDIDGLLYDYAVPTPPNLYPTTRANVGKMRNSGVEVLISVTPIRNKDIEWNTTATFSTNSNKLISLSNDMYQTSTDYFLPGWISEPVKTESHIVKVGEPIGNFYGYKVVDISDDGKWIYEDKDGNLVPYDQFTHSIDDKKVIGNGLPKYYASWNNSIRYKNFDLNISMRGAFKFQIINGARMYYENTNLEQYNRLQSAYDKIYGKAILNKVVPGEFNSYYVENGDYWKIDNVTLGYTINNLGIKYIKSMRLYLSSLNTLTISGYKGINPEVSSTGLAPGYDNRDQYPSIRSYTFGVNIKF
ncbi:SusC/RagA family TonB-linked outer membrane protein [Dysgonomonas sp. Marseille-P4677]|uniref:SusC/RagA family TonB-linked outer membrane protein n=1 Tax=Dysgonomonas sp. Marseille-P4677 TaxID=2364790 RepID=UPI001913D978|nr:SusC/RagA family TonB-linked outer membrane protein [Dysgonomonas sp. Marseille-P4677]MBK5721980.1 SusC/RagA family TonB-linked outer membrane protein [Dysgonomonas sp. Marseille-P4677]